MNYNTGEQELPPERSLALLSVPLLLGIGWVIYELTAQPALGVAAVCTKFGWEDFRTAWWLRRRDPRRGRAWACFWLYCASGLWKIAITASLLIFAYVFLLVMGLVKGQQAAFHMLGAILTAFAGILLTTLTTCAAIGLAWWAGVRLWLNNSVHRARRLEIWPPPDRHAHTPNVAGILLGTSLFAALVPILFVGLYLLDARIKEVQPPGPPGLMFLVGFPGSVLLLILVLVALVRGVLSPRIFAELPSQCWSGNGKPPATARPPEPMVERFVSDEITASREASWQRG